MVYKYSNLMKALIILVLTIVATYCTLTGDGVVATLPGADGSSARHGLWGRRCRNNWQCSPREVCVLRRCVPRRPVGGCFPPCRHGTTCRNRICVPDVIVDICGGCRPPKVCGSNGICQLPGPVCGNRFCNFGEICHFGVCKVNDGCNFSCVSPSFCRGSVCVFPPGFCGSSSDCLPRQTCRNGRC